MCCCQKVFIGNTCPWFPVVSEMDEDLTEYLLTCFFEQRNKTKAANSATQERLIFLLHTWSYVIDVSQPILLLKVRQPQKMCIGSSPSCT